MKMRLLIVTIILSIKLIRSSWITYSDGIYHNFVIEIDDTVRMDGCERLLSDIEKTVTIASNHLRQSLHGFTQFGTAILVIPKQWPDQCLPSNRTVIGSQGEPSDMTIYDHHPIYSDRMYVQQTGGCGQQGDQIMASRMGFDDPLRYGRQLAVEWAKYRYGIFDEIGFKDDPIYPLCYDESVETIHCGQAVTNRTGLCNYNVESIREPVNRTEIDNKLFCDNYSHNRYAPTKHNQLCNRISPMMIINSHRDFQQRPVTNEPVGEVKFIYKKRLQTRYVVIIDETRDTAVRESWTFLRMAIRKWLVYDLPDNTQVGIILANETMITRNYDIRLLSRQLNREYLAGFIPFTPGESRKPACVQCAVDQACQMLDRAEQSTGPASQIILIIGPGTDYKTNFTHLIQQANRIRSRLVTVNYPNIIGRLPMDRLADGTGGEHYTITEQKQNAEKSYLTTYFDLCNTLYDVMVRFFEGNRLQLPIEIHRRELYDELDEKPTKNSRLINGAFMLDATMGRPASMFLYTHNVEHPLIGVAKLSGPSGQVESMRTDQRLPVKQLGLSADISETGTWTYVIERVNGNPQPHYVQVMATAKNLTVPAIRTRAWLKMPVENGPVIAYVELTRGRAPIIDAFVEIRIRRPTNLCTRPGNCDERYRLLDTGTGEPDTTKHDGVYSRYINLSSSGLYRFDFIATDNGNTAYSIPIGMVNHPSIRCCGSIVQIPIRRTMPAFQRYLPTIYRVIDSIEPTVNNRFGSIGDLRGSISNDSTKICLVWTSPDMGGKPVVRYDIRYAHNVIDLLDNFETVAREWLTDAPLIYSIGDDTQFAMNMTDRMAEVAGRTVYIGIRAFSDMSGREIGTPISNYVEIFIPKPVDKEDPHDLLDPSQHLDSLNENSTKPYFHSDSLFGQYQLEYIIALSVISVVCCLIILSVCLWFRRRRRCKSGTDSVKNFTNFPVTKEIPEPTDPDDQMIKPTDSYSQSTWPKFDYPPSVGGSLMESPINQQTDDLYGATGDLQTIGVPIVEDLYRIPEGYQRPSVSVIGTIDEWNPRIDSVDRRQSPLCDDMDKLDRMALLNSQMGPSYVQQDTLTRCRTIQQPPKVPPLPHLIDYMDGRPQPRTTHRQLDRLAHDKTASLQSSINSINSNYGVGYVERKKTRNVTMV